MTTSNVFVADWPRKLAVWLAITSLLPLVAYFGAAALFTPPENESYDNTRNSLNEQINSAAAADKPALRAKLDKLEKDHVDANRRFALGSFWVAYCLGMVAAAIGLFVPAQAIGAGLMFGGIFAVAGGCYNAWDGIGRWLRFGALLFALLVFLTLSILRFRKQPTVDLIQT